MRTYGSPIVRRAFAVALFLRAGGIAIAASGDLPAKLEGHGGPIKAISVSADGKRVLTASFDYSIIYWDISKPKGRIVSRLIGHESAVNDVAFVPGSDRAVSVSDDGTLGIWDLEKGALVKRIPAPRSKVLDIDVSADGRLAAVARWDHTARIYDLFRAEEVAVLSGHRGPVNSVVFSADASRLYSASYDGTILEWDVAKGERLRPIYRHGWGINTLALIDKDRLLFGAVDGTVGIAGISAADKIADLAKRDRPIQRVKLSHDGALMAYGDGSGHIGVFLASSGTLVEESDVTFGPIWDFDFVPDTYQMFHVGLDDFVARWQIAPRKFAAIKSKYPRRFQVRDATDAGELEFQRKCSVCHTLTPDDGNRAGPTLYKLFGRRAGTLKGYQYSKALIDSDIVWSEETIGRLFDHGPDKVLPGTKMPLQRLKSVTRRDALIDFLKRATKPKAEE